MDNHQEDKHKQITIIVNTRPHKWEKKEISFEEVVALAYNDASDPNLRFAVDYSRGEDSHKEGTLTAGQSVKVKEGMVFNVFRSNKS